jgi:fucose 4-O-acetylase-like acetyltransferase
MEPAGRGLERDRFVDLVRGGSIVAVVVGHWLVADVRWSVDPSGMGALHETSALAEVPGMWPLTWLLVVIPLFFFVGGYANRRSWEATLRRGEGYATFVDRRVHRVLAPSGLYLAVVLVAGLAADRLGGLGIRALGGLFLQPLWFLGAYLVVVGLAPVTLWAHRRYGIGAVALLLGVVVLADLGRFAGGVPAVGYVNVLAVWLLMHQLGYFYVDHVPGWRVAATMLVGGLAATAALVAFGPYTASMVGVTDGPVGNMHPPTLAITALGVAQIGGALLLRGPLLPVLQRPRIWLAVVVVNLYVVSIYLWHQAARTLTARVLLPAGYPDPPAGSGAWWAARVLWLFIPGVVLALLVALVGRAEQVTPPRPIAAGRRTAAIAAAAVVAVGLGYLALAGSSATEPLAAGQSLGPLTASPVLGVALLGASAATFAALRAVAPAARRTGRPRRAVRAGP